jgi:DNA-binding transcriptional MocR family regulator
VTDTNWTPDLSAFPGPKYLGLSRALREAIRAGELAPGARLPPVRELAWAIGVTPGTVARAYQQATQEGLLAATVGRGTFVATATPRLGPTQPLHVERPRDVAGHVNMRSPTLPEIGQAPAFAAALDRIGRGISVAWHDYPSQTEEAPLRRAVCDWLSDRALGPLDAEDVALTLGGQNAISLIFLCCLRGDRPVVLTEDLSYPGFRHAARLARAEVIGVETDREGMVPDALEAACRRHGAQVLCLTAEAQNPTTARLTPARREAIVAIARRYDLQIIDDDCYALSVSDLPSLRAMAPERCWHVGSWSKSISPALRFGYIACPRGLGQSGRLTAQHSFFALPRPLTELALDLLESGEARRLRALVQDEQERRLAAVVAALQGQDLAWRPGVQFLYLRLRPGWQASAFARAAEAEGVFLRPADEFAAPGIRAPNAVRLALAGRAPWPDFTAALDRVARLLQRPPQEAEV